MAPLTTGQLEIANSGAHCHSACSICSAGKFLLREVTCSSTSRLGRLLGLALGTYFLLRNPNLEFRKSETLADQIGRRLSFCGQSH